MKTVCVFCASNLGANIEYQNVATEFGSMLAARGLDLVYGGANVGLMRCVAEAAMAGGSKVTGVITEFLAGRELAQTGLEQMIVVGSMPERKATMERISDGFCILIEVRVIKNLLEHCCQKQVGGVKHFWSNSHDAIAPIPIITKYQACIGTWIFNHSIWFHI